MVAGPSFLDRLVERVRQGSLNHGGPRRFGFFGSVPASRARSSQSWWKVETVRCPLRFAASAVSSVSSRASGGLKQTSSVS